MNTIKTKFSIGDIVTHFTGVSGMITAIFYRSSAVYEMSFLDDGKPTCIVVNEYEICLNKDNSFGFNKD